MTRLELPVIACAVAGLLAGGSALAQSAAPSANDFGGIGLLETRTARMAADGTVEIGGFAREPYRGVYVLAQPFPWLEITFRTTDFTNVRRDGTLLELSQIDFLETVYGFKGGGTVRDRGFDMKLRLVEENGWRPAIAVGLQDMFGEARFGGEYVVASKRFGPLDFSFGLGWGFLGSRDHVGNPLDLFGNGFRTRRAREGEGGINFGSFFSGRDVAFFGGVEWHTPLEGLSFQLEYSGIDPARAPFAASFDQDLPVNFGFSYRPVSWFDIAVGFERGNTLMTRAALRFDLFDLQPRRSGEAQPRERPSPSEDPETPAGETESIDLVLVRHLERRGLGMSRVSVSATEASLLLDPDHAPPPADFEAEARQLFPLLPDGVGSLWIRRADDDPRRAILFLHGRDFRKTARILADLADDGAVRIVSDRLLVKSAGNELPDDMLLALPRNVRMLEDAEGGTRDVRPVLAQIRARRLAAALTDLGAVHGMTIDGEGRAIALIDQMSDAGDVALDRLVEETGLGALMLRDAASVTLSDEQARHIFSDLARAGIHARAMALTGDRLTLWIAEAPADREAETIGRSSRRLLAVAPERVKHIRIIRAPGAYQSYGVDLVRRDVARAAVGRGSPEEVWLTSRASGTSPGLDLPDHAIGNDALIDRFAWGIVPTLEQTIGNDAGSIYLADLNIDLALRYEILPGLSLSGALRRFVVGTLDNLVGEVSPGLAQARSDFRDFVVDGRTAIPYLTADWLFSPARDMTARVSAGLFERMYGGIGGEFHYRPEGSRLAATGELFWVKKRDSDGFFGFDGRDVVTGELGAIAYLFDDDVEVSVRAGRYLAGDLGLSVELSRRFDNGIRIGGIMTLSEDADRDFRSDSLNKSVYITLPISGWWPFAGPRSAMSARFTEIARDSGARLILNERLHEFVSRHALSRLYRDWPQYSDTSR
ncbi:MAG: hypothetical protein Tsb008_00020 [Rhodothalassiaceae bacterium]